MSLVRMALCALLVAFAGCSSSPANVAGSYTVSLTDDANGCMFMNWTGTTSGVPVDITQNGTAATATIGGVAAGAFDAVLGSHVMSGNVDGNHIDLVIHGTRSVMQASCTLMLDAHASVELVGDTLQNGTITYQYVTNHDATCPIYTQTCTSTQLFNGTRPPTR